MTPSCMKGGNPLKIFRCERCRKPCMLTTLDDENMKFCPADGGPVDWKLVNREEKAVCVH